MKIKRHIAMFGPDLGLKGGISFVVLAYLKAGLHREVPLLFIPTTTDGSRIKKRHLFPCSHYSHLESYGEKAGGDLPSARFPRMAVSTGNW